MQLLIFAAFLLSASAKLFKPLTFEEGNKIAQDFMASMTTGFRANDFTAQKSMMASSMTWQWSGDVSGKGTQAEYYRVLEGSWQAIVSEFLPSNVFTVVDTATGEIAIAHELFININGHGKGPDCFFHGHNVFTLRLDDDRKINHFGGLWDPLNAELNACIASALGDSKEL